MDITCRFDPHEPLVKPCLATADEALDFLRAGHAQFVETNSRLLASSLASGPSDDTMVIPSSLLGRGMTLVRGAAVPQRPFAIVLSCSDSRVPVEEVFQVHANSIFVVRVAGNVIGSEVLASISYALSHFQESLRLLVVLGHSGCGAVTAAVDSFLSWDPFDEVAPNHALRSLIDRLLLSVRLASQTQSPAAASVRSRRLALIESASYVHAALTALELRRQLGLAADGPVQVVHGVYDLRTMRVHCMPQLPPAESATSVDTDNFLAEAPYDSGTLVNWSARVGDEFRDLPDVNSMTEFLLPAMMEV
jgi:carbonic anhydrase